MIKIKDLKVTRGDFCANLPTLSIADGQCVALCGVSGSGKSTLLEAIALLIEHFEVGLYQFNQLDLMGLSLAQRNALRISMLGFMPQTGGLLPFLTIKENLVLQITLALKHSVSFSSDGDFRITNLSKNTSLIAQKLERIKPFIERLGLFDKLDYKPDSLSIGQRQRALFIRAIAHEPKFLLIDEPTSSLDPENASNLFAIIHQTATQTNLSVLIVTHDLDSVSNYQRYCYSHKQSQPNYSIFLPE